MEENELIEKFLSDSTVFIDDFQPVFVEYFVDLCESYDKFYSRETLKEVATVVYKDVFNADMFLSTFEKDIFKDMFEDGIMIGFLISKSMFFLLDNYIENSKKQIKYKMHIQTIILCITQYINRFERDIYGKNRTDPLHINFDTAKNFSSGINIFDTFKKIKNKGDEVTFFNLYKGIPVQHKATIVDIDDDEIVFRTVQTQEIAMKMDGVAYILKDSNFHKFVKADIVYNNFSNNTVVLNNFTYLLNMPATNRESIRVHPDIMAKVSLCSKDNLITSGKLFDLSIDGLGVISEENNGIYAGAKINIDFQLETSDLNKPSNINVEGEILNIIEYSSSYRYCIKIYPKADIEEKIENYVKAREIEILASLYKEIEFYK